MKIVAKQEEGEDRPTELFFFVKHVYMGYSTT